MLKNSYRAFVCVSALVVSSATAFGFAYADDVTDLIEQAKTQYEDGQLSAAKSSLEFATQLIVQQNATSLESYLPEPLDGWSSQDGDGNTASSTVYGGGISAEREYTNDSSDVRVAIVGDSPLIAQMGVLFSNPMLMTASGNQSVLVNGNMAMVQNDEVQMMVANRFLVTISGSASKEDKIQYAKAIDQTGLSTFGGGQ